MTRSSPSSLIDDGLEGAVARHVHRFEPVAHAEQGLATRDGPAAAHDRIQLLQALDADAGGQAQLLQRAVRATPSKGIEIDDRRGHAAIVAAGLIRIRLGRRIARPAL